VSRSILDATKLWPEDLVPKIEVGEIVLNRVVDEFFTEVEQIAFCTSHVVPGVSFSDDPLLQGRNFSYFDTQITRLGPNFQELPINRPLCPVMNFNRDGAMRHRITKGKVNYWPNRFDVVAPQKFDHTKALEYPQPVHGVKQRYRGPKFDEHFQSGTAVLQLSCSSRAAAYYQRPLFRTGQIDEMEIIQRMIERLNQVDFELARQVAKNVGGNIPKDSALTTRKRPSTSVKKLSTFDTNHQVSSLTPEGAMLTRD
jgi:catalase